jgi:hypothetical protein
MIRQHGGVPAILEARRLSEHDQEYLTRALQVVPPVPDLPIGLPPGRRDRYPEHPDALNTLMAAFGLQAASSRLVEALNEHVREA